ncbi:hypothetical protein RCL_jg2468.t1 [Rhizophagus clarus]|uniref:Uncharacterized protein n=1 Tax=Rhizophagus clarus TaxID=94130 RepID=A0A8H3L2Q3_9GLOM|nr:hypothetical protein RCL_jg2468.t1 [Rhizophagus clarus]
MLTIALVSIHQNRKKLHIKQLKILSPDVHLVSFKSLGSSTKIGTFVKYDDENKTICTIFYDGEDKHIEVSNILTFKAIKNI